MRNGAVFPIIFFLLLSGCIGQLSEEQKYAAEHNMSQKAAGCFDGDGNISVTEDAFGKTIGALPHDYQDDLATYFGCDMAKISDVTAHKDSPFFDDMMETGSLGYSKTFAELDKSYPQIAEQMAKEGGPNPTYLRARKAWLGTVPAFELSHKQLGPDESNVFKYIAFLDTQAQIEAAKAYGVNLEFNELEFFAKDPYGANKVLQGGYSDIEDKYVEEVMSAFNADLATYLTRGALNDDGSITQGDYQDLQWFETAYKRMDPGISNKFNEIMRGNGIGTIEAIGVTEEYLKDPYDPTMSIIPMGRKFYVKVSNPGDYIENGQRIIKIGTGYGEYYEEVRIKNPATKTYRFFDNPLVAGSKIDHMISDVDGQYYVVNDMIGGILVDRSTSHFFNFFDNYFGIGYENPAQISAYGNGIAHATDRDERWWCTDIYIHGDDDQKHRVSLNVIPPRGIFQNISYKIHYSTPTGWLVCYDENGKYTEDSKHAFGKESNKEYQYLYKVGDTLIMKLLPWLKQMRARWRPI